MAVRLHSVKSRSPRQPHLRLARLSLELLEDRSLLDAAAAPELLLTLRNGQIQTAPVAQGVTVDQALAAARARPDVAAAELNQTVSVSVIPNDPNFGTLWGLNNTGQSGGVPDADIDAPEAWDSWTGGTNITVGVIDTGMDYTHPDLYLNVWINQAEIPAAIRSALTDTDGDGLITFWDLNNPVNIGAGKITDLNGNGYIDAGDILKPAAQGGWANGVSDDGDGYVDDLVGWNFVNNTNNPFDDNGHGTHVSGTIGAVGNNGIGVTGINWKTQIAALKFLDSSGSGSTANAVAALNYATAHGIQVTNNSWGGGGFSSALNTAISNAQAHGYIFVAAAGNASSNNDTTANYPSNYPQSNVVAVAATTRTDALASFSNFGATTVDLGAPGSSILSTTPNNTYSIFSGTSMATPHVAGAIALVWSQSQMLTYTQVINRILSNVDPDSALAGRTVTGGRLNVQKALNATPPPADTTGPHVTAATAGAAPVSSVRVTFSESINPSSFTAADVTLTGPGGAVAVTGVTPVAGTGNTQFDITFAVQSTAGVYTFTVGPNVADAAGNLMDQNQNGVNGEATDVYTGSFTVDSGPRQYTATPNAPIRDFTTTTSTITVPDSFTIGDVNVKININHTWDGDLRIRLQGPGGTTFFTLSNRRGGSGDNFTNTVFDDEATVAISAGRAPFTGSFRPETALSGLDGGNAQGTWTLTVFDAAAGDIGTLLNWTLILTPSPGGLSLHDSAAPVAAEAAGGFGGVRLQAPSGLPAASLSSLAAFLAQERTPAVQEVRSAVTRREESRPVTEAAVSRAAREEEAPGGATTSAVRHHTSPVEDETPLVWEV